jgi:hypothetical protein
MDGEASAPLPTGAPCAFVARRLVLVPSTLHATATSATAQHSGQQEAPPGAIATQSGRICKRGSEALALAPRQDRLPCAFRDHLAAVRAPAGKTRIRNHLAENLALPQRPTGSRDAAAIEVGALGYLLVVIPISPDAPHQVGEKYRGRGDTTNIVLSDAEVSRLHSERSRHAVDMARLLDAEVARDPTSAALRTQGHLFVVAQPLVPRADLLGRILTTAADWQAWLGVTLPRRLLEARQEDTAPYLFGGTSVSPRPDGWAIHAYEIGVDRHLRPNGASPVREDNLLDLEIRDDGGLRLFCGRASTVLPRDPPVTFVFHKLIATLTYHVVNAAIAVADQADYLGGWGFAVAIRGIGKAIVDDSAYGGIMRVVDDYAQPVSVSLAELQDDPKGVVTRLLGRLYRGMGVPDFILASDLIPRGFLNQ